jgi:hypothetical protein
MSTYTLFMLLGWTVLIVSWFPKAWMIKNDRTRRLVNLCLATVALAIFLATGYAEFILKPEGL